MTSRPFALKPRLSEKTFALSKDHIYVFDVPKTVNVNDVKAAVQREYKVSVVDVRTTIINGKVKRSARRRSQPMLGQRSDFKKAYVTLKKGDSIPVFEEEK